MNNMSSYNVLVVEDENDIAIAIEAYLNIKCITWFKDSLNSDNYLFRKNMPEGKVILPLDSQRTFRVFENLIINITNYAMPNTRVFIDVIENSPLRVYFCILECFSTLTGIICEFDWLCCYDILLYLAWE